MNKIKLFRKEKKMTIRELSEKTGVATGYLSTLENDEEGNVIQQKIKWLKFQQH